MTMLLVTKACIDRVACENGAYDNVVRVCVCE